MARSHFTMTVRPVILSLCLTLLPLAPAAFAQPAAVTPIERANADAVARLYARIGAENVANVSVAQIVERVDGYAILINGLSRAEQIGGPRQVADGVVQVRLSISGARASQLLLQAVAAKPDKSPVPPDRLAFLLKMWADRTFTSTGDNIESAAALPNDATTRPVNARVATTNEAVSPAPAAPAADPTPGWRAAPTWVNDSLAASASAASVGSPLRTARAAEQSARKALHDKLRALTIADSGTLGDAADKRPEVAAAIDEAVGAARVSGIDYNADGSVEVRIAVGGQRLWQRIASAR